MFPKIMVPRNHPILIRFSIIFTIHFGVFPPIFGNIHMGSFLGGYLNPLFYWALSIHSMQHWRMKVTKCPFVKLVIIFPLGLPRVWTGPICAMVKSRYIGDGHPTFNRNPYNGYINPYYWVDDHPLLYGNNGSLDSGTYKTIAISYLH